MNDQMTDGRAESLDSHRDFWRRQFSRRVDLVLLPFDKPRPPVPSYLRETVDLALDRSFGDGLEELRARLGVPLATVFLVALKTVLFRYAGPDMLVVGVTVQEENSPHEPSAAAPDLLPIQTHWTWQSDLSGEALARILAERMSDARAHAAYPLRELQSWAGAQDAAFGTRLFNVALCVATATNADSAGWPMPHPDGNEFLTQCDVVITAVSHSAGLMLKGDFDADAFEAPTIRRLLGHLGTILQGIMRCPAAPVLRLPMLTPSEEQQLVVERNVRKANFPPATLLHGMFEAQVERTPEAVALICDDQSLTYRELNRRANRLAHALRERNVGPDTIVGICMDRSLELMIALLGILKAGGAYLPIDLAYPRERLAFMLEDANAPVLLTQSKLAADLPAHQAKVLCLDEAELAAFDAYSTSNPESGAAAENLAYVIFTSGSTGQSKGVLVTHYNVVRLFDATQDWYEFNERDVWTLFHSYAFDFSVWELWGALLYGGRAVIVPYWASRSPQDFRELLVRERVTVLNQTPSAFRQLLQAELAQPKTDLALRYVIFGGEALELQSLRPWFERYGDKKPLLVNMYGITETTVHVTYRPIRWDDLRSGQGSVIGGPIPDLQVYILDPNGKPVPVGVPGEMYVGGAGVARGYLNRPELTAQRFIADPFHGGAGTKLYRTGDLARRLENGDIQYLGRSDHQVKIRGFRVELGEIEAGIARHPAIREVVVTARADAPGDKRLVAYLVAENLPADLLDKLRALLRAAMPEYMVPAHFVVLAALPLTENGKVDRKALPAPAVSRDSIARPYVAPRTPVEKALAQIWSTVLGIDEVGIHEHFFELGGDSILSIQVISRCRQVGLHLKPKDLFDRPTIAQLAEACAPVLAEAGGPDELLTGTVPLTPIERWFLEQDIAERDHWNQAFLFELSADVDLAVLEQALHHVIRHHDTLRLRLRPDGTNWVQEYGSLPPPQIANIDLSGDSAAQQRAPAIEKHAAKVQASLNLADGPLLRAVHFSFGPGECGRLLLVIHHIAVDGVSWRLIREDLEAAYFSLLSGEQPTLPTKTTSYQVWANRLAGLTRSPLVIRSLSYWLTEASKPVTSLPGEQGCRDSFEGKARSMKIYLTSEETQALLQRVPAVYQTQINDVLLVALARALQHWTGGSAFRIDLERHGREDLAEVDVSRTVGWFTTMFPVRLELQANLDEGQALKSVKEQLRRIPDRGMSYGLLRYGDDPKTRAALSHASRSALLFNYLGQFDQVVAGSSLFGFATESTGPWHSPRSRRTHALEVLCLVRAGKLEIEWIYDPDTHGRDAIERVAHDFLAAVRATLAHCLSAGVGGRTPSDFPLAVLSQEDVDRLWERYPAFEDVYPLSPMQRLFHAMEGTRADPGFEQWHFRLQGAVNAAQLRTSIERVVARHAMLRTAFVSDVGAEPLQIVLPEVSLPWSDEDWRGFNPAQQEARLTAFMQSDRRAAFDLPQAPLMRVALWRIDDESFHLVWSTHHLYIDGWSWPLVFREVSQIYEALRRDVEPHLTVPMPYRSYIAWLRTEAPDSERFWTDELAGITAPTPLNLAARPTGSQARVAGLAEESALIDQATTCALQTLARTQHVTLSTIVQGAWSLLLSHYSASPDVVFGAAFSGRPPELSGIRSLIGPCVNNLPVRVTAAPGESLLDWLSRLQQRQFEFTQHQYVALEQIQKWTNVPWRYRLFDSLIVFQNYEVDESARRLGSDVHLVPIAAPETTNYPLTVTVSPEAELRLRLIYHCDRFVPDVVRAYAANLTTVLRAIAQRPELTVADLKALLPASLRGKAAALAAMKAPESRAACTAPATETERALASLWQDLFGVERVSLDDNFFDLGGHSLLLLQAHSRLRTVRPDLPVVALLQYPTIRTLARYLSGHAAPSLAASAAADRARKQREALSRQRSIIEKT